MKYKRKNEVVICTKVVYNININKKCGGVLNGSSNEDIIYTRTAS